MFTNTTPLEILEIDYSVSPNGVNAFEVYNTYESNPLTPPIYETEELTDAVRFCYNLGRDFTVRTIAQWNMENM